MDQYTNCQGLDFHQGEQLYIGTNFSFDTLFDANLNQLNFAQGLNFSRPSPNGKLFV